MGVYFKLVIGRCACWLTEADITSLDTLLLWLKCLHLLSYVQK